MKIREIYNKLLANYRLTSLTISGLTFLIFLFFTTKLQFLPFGPAFLGVSAALSISIGYQYAIIKHFLLSIYPTFGKLRPLFQYNQYQTFSQDLEKKLHKSWLYYLTIIVVVTSFVILELIEVWEWKRFNGPMPPYFNLIEHDNQLWSLLFDIINHIFRYLSLFLLAVIIWIMITLTLIVNELKEKYTVNIDVFDIDETGGLKPLRYFVLSVVNNYFIIVALAMISGISSVPLPPITLEMISYIYYIITSPEIILLILMFLIGVILFITTQKTIRNLIDKGVKFELEKINRKYRETCDKIIEISSSEGNNNYEKELEKLRVILDILEKEEININRIKHKRFDINAIITFITTALLPIITLIEKIMEFAGSK